MKIARYDEGDPNKVLWVEEVKGEEKCSAVIDRDRTGDVRVKELKIYFDADTDLGSLGDKAEQVIARAATLLVSNERIDHDAMKREMVVSTLVNICQKMLGIRTIDGKFNTEEVASFFASIDECIHFLGAKQPAQAGAR